MYMIFRNEKILSLYSYIRVRLRNLLRRNRYIHLNPKRNLPFRSINIKTSFFNPYKESRWNEFAIFLRDNSNIVNLKIHDPLLDVKLFNSFNIGGFGEVILINLVFAIAYDVSKKLIIKLMQEIQKSSDSYMTDDIHNSGFHNFRINIQYPENKKIIITMPFPAKVNGNIANLDFNDIDAQFKYSNTALLDYDYTEDVLKKGKILDAYK